MNVQIKHQYHNKQKQIKPFKFNIEYFYSYSNYRLLRILKIFYPTIWEFIFYPSIPLARAKSNQSVSHVDFTLCQLKYINVVVLNNVFFILSLIYI